MKVRQYAMVTTAILAPFVLSLVLGVGCKNCGGDETEVPPISSAVPTPSASTTVAPEEDAGADASDAATDAAADAKVVTGDPTGLKLCCVALRNNATTVPDDQKAGYLGAADVCDAAVKTQQTRAALIQIRSFLKNAKVPSACQ